MLVTIKGKECKLFSAPIYGAIIGDIVGSVFEGMIVKGDSFHEAETISCCKYFSEIHPKLHLGVNIRTFPLFGLENQRFTDDTVLTCAVLYSLVYQIPYSVSYKLFANTYPEAGYGKFFQEWAKNLDLSVENQSFGNGAAMRISPIGGLYHLTRSEIGIIAEEASIPTHGHANAINAAKAVAKAIHMISHGSSKEQIKEYIEDNYNYDLNVTTDEYRQNHQKFVSDAIKTVPVAFRAFLEGNNISETIRKAISCGGDTDTTASIAGALAAADPRASHDLLSLKNALMKFLDKNITNLLSKTSIL